MLILLVLFYGMNDVIDMMDMDAKLKTMFIL